MCYRLKQLHETEERETMWKILVALSCVLGIAAAECFKDKEESENI